MESDSTDVLVIGAGAAGLCVALNAAPRRVLLLAPQGPHATATTLAQGGIAAPIGRGDSVALHLTDTLIAGDHSVSETAAARIVASAADAIAYLHASGLEFDTAGDGPDLHLEAGHSRPRILHAGGDRTGAAVEESLWQRARAADHVTIRRDLTATALRGGPAGIAGALTLRDDGSVLAIDAAETVLATGGLGQLFAATTNPAHAGGDGLAMALAAGAAVQGLEFVQFHPTALHCRSDPLPLLTEALRGAGAQLIAAGRPFMARIDPRGDLAPRDVVARAVWERQQRGAAVALDATRIFSGRQADEFPAARAACAAHGIDPAVSPIPVTCAAHFHMGGVAIDARGHSSLPGLWAVGEVACSGLHGANRLASNSLLEAIVVGSAAGRAIAAEPRRIRPAVRTRGAAIAAFEPDQPQWNRLRRIMWDVMGPVRDGTTLAAGIRRLRRLRAAVDPAQATLLGRLGLAEAMVRAAKLRLESRGAHWRRDFPRRDHARDGAAALGIMASPEVPLHAR
ncbi:MAG: FAD-binding protein [Gammaproteobacteria bacterium]|nr:FAD-binding protein [Gammaproteobacteria bacterium]